MTYAPAGRCSPEAATPGDGSGGDFRSDRDTVADDLQPQRQPLAAPWGITLAPAGFGQFGGDLLVGNFSFVASEINAFDPTTGMFEGTIPIDMAAATRQAAFGPSASGPGGSTGAPTPSTSPMVSTARRTGCLARYPYQALSSALDFPA